MQRSSGRSPFLDAHECRIRFRAYSLSPSSRGYRRSAPIEMPVTWAMALGSVATTKRNASQGVEAGWYLLLSKVDSPPSGTQVAEVLFFREEADALAASTLVRATQSP